MPESALRNLVPSINTAMNNAAQAPFGRPQRIPIYRNEPEFIDRSLNPQNYPVINNPDGSTSSHRMAAEVDENGNWYVFPTIQMQPDGTLRQYDDAREAMKAAFMTGNILRAPNMKSALQYAEGGYKVGTPMEQTRSAPAQEPVQPASDQALRALDQAYMMGIGQGPAPARVPRTRGQTAADMLGAAAIGTTPIPIVGDITGMAADLAMYAAYPEKRTMGNYAMSALGVLPLVPGVAAARAARGASPLEGTLDMSQSARMQRAAEQGFDTNRPLYHSTNTSFDAFEIPEGRFLKFGKGVYSAPSPDYSDRYIRKNRDIEAGYNEGANIMPLYARGKIGTEKDWEQARQEMLAEGVNPKGYNPLQEEIQRRLKEKGFDGLNMFGNETIIFNPSNIRSVNAAFDPAKRGSANLMAGAAGATIGLSALRNIQRDEEPQPD